MIGVVANGVEHSTIVEFFELFKTPWEFHRPGSALRRSNLLKQHGSGEQRQVAIPLRCAAAGVRGVPRNQDELCSGHDFVSFRGERMPIYGNCLLFNGQGNEVLLHEGTNSAAAVSITSGDQAVVRLGFDLFEEVHHLLTKGQPAELAEHTHTGTSHFASPGTYRQPAG